MTVAPQQEAPGVGGMFVVFTPLENVGGLTSTGRKFPQHVAQKLPHEDVAGERVSAVRQFGLLVIIIYYAINLRLSAELRCQTCHQVCFGGQKSCTLARAILGLFLGAQSCG